jgi:hypothetical protein
LHLGQALAAEVIIVLIFVWFGLVWRAVTGNTDNLPSGWSLSITISCKAENKFSLFPCQARNPSNHKEFSRLHDREVTGKYFPAAHKSGKIQRGKSQAMAATVRA